MLNEKMIMTGSKVYNVRSWRN